ncbi:MAG: putative toxin-antitoxin system toxin component, PIN family [Candidatus Eremiobacterota bacterium]
MIKVVFDTNIFISGIFFGGKSREGLELPRTGKFKLFSSKEIINELKDVLSKRFDISDHDIDKIIKNIKKYTVLIDSPSKVDIVRDPKDNKILDCAIASMSRYLVTGDNDLLVIRKHKQIEIMTINDFLEKKPWS